MELETQWYQTGNLTDSEVVGQQHLQEMTTKVAKNRFFVFQRFQISPLNGSVGDDDGNFVIQLAAI